MAGPTTKPASHLAHVDGLRAALAIYVVGQHCYSTVTGDHPSPALWGSALWAFAWLNYGRLAVGAFLVVSGYCLMLPIVRRGGRLSTTVPTFYWRRCRRILPTFYAAVAVCALAGRFPLSAATGTIWDTCLPVTPGGLATQLLMAGDRLRTAKINYVFWSVAVEWRIYFAFPALVWAFRRFGPLPTTAAVLAVTTPLAIAVRSHEVVRNTVSYAGLFTLGMAAATVARPIARLGVVAVALLAGIVAAAAWVGPAVMKHPLCDLAVAAATAAALAHWAGCPASPARRLLAGRPLAAVGTFSYSLYLIHAPVVQALWVAVGQRCGGGLLVLFAAAVPASVAAAYLFFLVAERPFVSVRQRRAAADAVTA